jgi:hypothetical protein
MRRHLHRGRFPALDGGAPRLDVAVLFVDPADHDPSRPPRGRYMADLKAAAEALAPRLLAQDALATSVRRIVGLGMKRDATGTVAAEVRSAWARGGP